MPVPGSKGKMMMSAHEYLLRQGALAVVGIGTDGCIASATLAGVGAGLGIGGTNGMRCRSDKAEGSW